MDNTFITVTWNNEKQITKLIDSIKKYEPESQIIVVDNHSTDNTLAALKKYQLTSLDIIALPTNVGFAKANNIAARQVTTKFVTFINPDTILNQSLINNLEQKMINEIGMIGVKIMNADGSLQPSIYKFQRPLTIYVEQFNIGSVLPEKLKERVSPENSQHNRLQYVDWLIGAFMFTKTEYYRSVGGFSEDYFLYSEDMDLCYKYHLKGLKILFEPDMKITHIGGTSESQTNTGKNIKLLTSFCIFAKKFGLEKNINALYHSYWLKEKIFRHLDSKRARKYKENVKFLKGKLS